MTTTSSPAGQVAAAGGAASQATGTDSAGPSEAEGELDGEHLVARGQRAHLRHAADRSHEDGEVRPCGRELVVDMVPPTKR